MSDSKAIGKRLGASLLATLLLAGCATSSRDVHLVENMALAAQPVPTAAMQARLEEAATHYAKIGSVARTAFMDIAAPGAGDETIAMRGHAVLLLTTLAHDPAELPPKRVYMTLDGKDRVLERITTAPVAAPTGNVAAVLGANRVDALYLLPLSAVRDGAELRMDFAAHRDAFVVERFTEEGRQYLLSDGGAEPVEGAPSADAVMALIQREFPGFVDGDR